MFKDIYFQPNATTNVNHRLAETPFHQVTFYMLRCDNIVLMVWLGLKVLFVDF